MSEFGREKENGHLGGRSCRAVAAGVSAEIVLHAPVVLDSWSHRTAPRVAGWQWRGAASPGVSGRGRLGVAWPAVVGFVVWPAALRPSSAPSFGLCSLLDEGSNMHGLLLLL